MKNKVMIFHSKTQFWNEGARVTAAGRFVNNQLTIAVARCSGKDSFQKRTIITPAKDAFPVINHKTGKPVLDSLNNPLIIPARKEEVVLGGVDLATNRLNDGKVFATFTLKECTVIQFARIAAYVCDLVLSEPTFVEGSKITL